MVIILDTKSGQIRLSIENNVVRRIQFLAPMSSSQGPGFSLTNIEAKQLAEALLLISKE